jgi:hypothetical protein
LVLSFAIQGDCCYCIAVAAIIGMGMGMGEISVMVKMLQENMIKGRMHPAIGSFIH